MRFLLCIVLLTSLSALAQPYTSYFTGDMADVSPATTPGTCLMGGATEHDEAMRWFLNRSGGGDVVVIRVTGSDGYNSYLYSGLGVAVNSVETLVIPSVAAANDPYVRQQLRDAEAIWIAGGDQWDYISLWGGTAVDTALNDHVNIKGAPIGGTSAGMAIMGGYYFSAQNGTITSATALADPFHTNMTIGDHDYMDVPFLENVITDTHYDSPDRRGRHTAFLARIVTDHGDRAFGIACDEYTAVCVDESGIAHVYGEFPTYDDNAYFLQANCVAPYEPETCTASTPLHWFRGGEAVKVYHVQGDLTGSKWFDLNDWETGSGGSWQDWTVSSGTLATTSGTQADCSTVDIAEHDGTLPLHVYPNPVVESLYLTLDREESGEYVIYDALGNQVESGRTTGSITDLDLPPGWYCIAFSSKLRTQHARFVVE